VHLTCGSLLQGTLREAPPHAGRSKWQRRPSTLLAVDRVDYVDTFIAVADDSTAAMGTVPPSKPGNRSVTARMFQMISDHPYRYTSGDVIFTVFADRHGIAAQERAAARDEFYSAESGMPAFLGSRQALRVGHPR
jgi:hypothetical protein